MTRLLALLVALAPLSSQAEPVPPAPLPTASVPARSWPGTAWVRATAYSYAWQAYGPTSESLHIYEPPRGLHSKLRSEHPMTLTQAKQALALVRATEGAVDISKCAFPRHGVVFYDAAGKAVGSVSVCFECGDILVWPDTQGPSRKKAGRDGVYRDAFLKRYDAAMARWQALFTALPDMPPDWKSPTRR